MTAQTSPSSQPRQQLSPQLPFSASPVYIDTSDSIAVRSTLDESLADYFKERYDIDQSEITVNVYILLLVISVTIALGLYLAEWLYALPPLNKYTFPVLATFFSLQVILFICQTFIWTSTLTSQNFALPNGQKGFIKVLTNMPQYSSEYHCQIQLFPQQSSTSTPKKSKPSSAATDNSTSDDSTKLSSLDIQSLFTTQGLFLNETFYNQLDIIFHHELEHHGNRGIAAWQKKRISKNKSD